MVIKTLHDLLQEGVSGRGVLVRSDLNVPLGDDLAITDPGRINASVPTLKALSDAGAKVVVTAHLGRPKDGQTRTSRSLRSRRRWRSGSAVTFSWPAMLSALTRSPVLRA